MPEQTNTPTEPRTYVVGLPVIVTVTHGPDGAFVTFEVDTSDCGTKALFEAVDNSGDEDTTDEEVRKDAAMISAWTKVHDVAASAWVRR